jgi:hypothetical protein
MPIRVYIRNPMLHDLDLYLADTLTAQQIDFPNSYTPIEFTLHNCDNSSLDEAWRQSQSIETAWANDPTVRSTAIGDVFEDIDEKCCYVICSMGYSKL